MKWILCISRVNFVPDNGLKLIQELLETPNIGLAGVIILENRQPKVLLRAFVAWVFGARRTAGSLLKHAFAPDPRQSLLNQAGIPLGHFKTVNSPQALQWISEQRTQGVQLGINVRTRCLYGHQALESLNLWLNMHHGLLPKWRGTSCDLHMMIKEGLGAVSLHQMLPQIDQGPIASTAILEPSKPKDYAQMILDGQQVEASMIRSILDKIRSQEQIHFVKNQDPQPIWCRTPGLKTIRQLVQQGYQL
jgi:methionyl-tRNA formyltransferase